MNNSHFYQGKNYLHDVDNQENNKLNPTSMVSMIYKKNQWIMLLFFKEKKLFGKQKQNKTYIP